LRKTFNPKHVPASPGSLSLMLISPPIKRTLSKQEQQISNNIVKIQSKLKNITTSKVIHSMQTKKYTNTQLSLAFKPSEK
jgi:hypothetical protein